MEGYLNLGLCVATTCVLLTGLRHIQRYKIDLPLFVGLNYVSAALVGWAFHPQAFAHVFAHSSLTVMAIWEGAAFFVLFNIMGWMTHRVGVGYMTIVAKMSLVIPVLFSWLHYGDAMTWLHFLGVGMAMVAIFLVNFGEKGNAADTGTSRWRVAILSLILFVGGGACDAGFKVLKQEHGTLVDSSEFVVVLFGMAALSSLPVILYRAARGELRANVATVLTGLVLGVPNYFSIVFLAGSLRYFDGTVFYPINNTAILLVMALVGILAYRERVNAWKIAGLAMATAAVVLLA